MRIQKVVEKSVVEEINGECTAWGEVRILREVAGMPRLLCNIPQYLSFYNIQVKSGFKIIIFLMVMLIDASVHNRCLH